MSISSIYAGISMPTSVQPLPPARQQSVSPSPWTPLVANIIPPIGIATSVLEVLLSGLPRLNTLFAITWTLANFVEISENLAIWIDSALRRQTDTHHKKIDLPIDQIVGYMRIVAGLLTFGALFISARQHMLGKTISIKLPKQLQLFTEKLDRKVNTTVRNIAGSIVPGGVSISDDTARNIISVVLAGISLTMAVGTQWLSHQSTDDKQRDAYKLNSLTYGLCAGENLLQVGLEFMPSRTRAVVENIYSLSKGTISIWAGLQNVLY